MAQPDPEAARVEAIQKLLADPSLGSMLMDYLAKTAATTTPSKPTSDNTLPRTPISGKIVPRAIIPDNTESPDDTIHESDDSQSWDDVSLPKSSNKRSSQNGKPQKVGTKRTKRTKLPKDKAPKTITTPTKQPSALKQHDVPPVTPSQRVTANTPSTRPVAVQNSTRQIQSSHLEDVTLGDLAGDHTLKRFVVGVDYGTTFTSVSYYSHAVDDDHPHARPDEVKVIMNWPEDGMGGMRRQVPTESWYSLIPKERPALFDQFELIEPEDDGFGPERTNASTLKASDTTQRNEDDDDLDGEESAKYLWGYEVPYQKFTANTTRDESRLIARPKLMLVSSEHSREDQQRLRPKLNCLIEGGMIRKFTHKDAPDRRDVQDVITDFMIEVFNYTKQQLIENAGYTQECPVSFVLTVPVVWNTKASRVLQYAVEAAIRESGFGTLQNGSVDYLFIIAEPEAAATYLMGNSHDMLAGETFIVLDCGGGTVDCVTYTVTNGYPLRLKTEVGKPTGDNCGASYLNDNFEKHLRKRLIDEHYLDRDGETRESIIRHLVPNFENHDKRNKDLARRPGSRIKIKGLQGDQSRGLTGASAKRFENNFLLLNSEDYNEIFMPILRRVGHVLWAQIEMAISKGKDIKKVFLIGGFDACPSLRSYLRDFLKDTVKEFSLEHEISLITTNEQESVTAVCSGAVLRALNKEGGPERRAACSYGFLRIQYWDPKKVKGHRDVKPVRDPFDQELYVSVIEYFMLKGTMVAPTHRYKPMTCIHVFDVDSEKLLCEELLYVSDIPLVFDEDTKEPLKSNYPLDHHHNRDAQIVGRIITDFTFLREEGKIQEKFPPTDEDGELTGKVHYEVEYDLIIIVEGRNLRYEARYPSGQGGKAQKTAQIGLAAGFLPGTG